MYIIEVKHNKGIHLIYLEGVVKDSTGLDLNDYEIYDIKIFDTKNLLLDSSNT